MLAVSLVADLNSQATSSSPDNFAEFDGAVYFRATDAKHGDELWRVDGDGTDARLLRDVVPGPVGSKIANLNSAGNHLFFTSEVFESGADPQTDAMYTVLHSTDGTHANVRELTRFPYQNFQRERFSEPESVVRDFAVLNDMLYFMTSHGEAENLNRAYGVEHTGSGVFSADIVHMVSLFVEKDSRPLPTLEIDCWIGMIHVC